MDAFCCVHTHTHTHTQVHTLVEWIIAFGTGVLTSTSFDPYRLKDVSLACSQTHSSTALTKGMNER